MSNWETKSNYSFAAANKLIDDKLYNPSVHSSYYACVQYVYHVMYEFFNEDKEAIELGSDGTSKTEGTHQWLRKYIYQSIKLKNKPAATVFRNQMGDLCGFRVEADYKYDIIGEAQANKCKILANNIVSSLKKHYDL